MVPVIIIVYSDPFCMNLDLVVISLATMQGNALEN